MAMSSGGGDKKAVQSEINVTPLIDVLLVLLIIFLVVMPIMMKMETLQIPPRLPPDHIAEPSTVLTVTVLRSLDISLDENGRVTSMPAGDLLRTLRPRFESWKADTDKIVFVHFEPEVEWSTVIQTMDTIRVLARDVNHDEIKVALKIKEDAGGGATQ